MRITRRKRGGCRLSGALSFVLAAAREGAVLGKAPGALVFSTSLPLVTTTVGVGGRGAQAPPPWWFPGPWRHHRVLETAMPSFRFSIKCFQS